MAAATGIEIPVAWESTSGLQLFQTFSSLGGCHGSVLSSGCGFSPYSIYGKATLMREPFIGWERRIRATATGTLFLLLGSPQGGLQLGSDLQLLGSFLLETPILRLRVRILGLQKRKRPQLRVFSCFWERKDGCRNYSSVFLKLVRLLTQSLVLGLRVSPYSTK